jgi:hypothetical protein
MKTTRRFLLVCALVGLTALFSGTLLYGQIGVGTWVRQSTTSTPGDITLTVDACCNGGRRLTYHIKFGTQTQLMVIESPFNGTEVTVMVDGKPSPETMAIKQVDSRHWTCIIKMNGQQFATSKGEISVDGKTINVENNVTSAAGGQPLGVQKEVWLKK